MVDNEADNNGEKPVGKPVKRGRPKGTIKRKIEIDYTEIITFYSKPSEFYYNKIIETERDLKAARKGGNFTAVANLSTRLHAYRKDYDAELAKEQLLEPSLIDLSEEEVLELLPVLYQELPEEIQELIRSEYLPTKE